LCSVSYGVSLEIALMLSDCPGGWGTSEVFMNRNLASGPVPARRANQARVSPARASPALEDRQVVREL
jgi:hypothetical protein